MKKSINIIIIASLLVFPSFINTTFADFTNNESDYSESQAALQLIPSQKLEYSLVPAYPTAVKPAGFYYEIEPGSTITDYAKINSSQDYIFNLYSADELITKDGNKTVKSKTAKQTNIGVWVQFENPEINVIAGQKNMQKFTINIPKDTPLGSYRGGLLIENIEPASAEQSGFNFIFRQSTPIEIKVTDDPQPVPPYVPPVKEVQADVFSPSPYFYVSLALFLACMGYFVYANRKEKACRELRVKEPKTKENNNNKIE